MMLVLSRRTGERICVGEQVVITLVSIQGDRVEIGIEAPPEIAVDREEVRERKNREGGHFSSSARDANPQLEEKKSADQKCDTTTRDDHVRQRLAREVQQQTWVVLSGGRQERLSSAGFGLPERRET